VIDFVAAWRDLLLTAADPRLDAATDRAFWEGAAPTYHQREGADHRVGRTLDHLASLVKPDDRLLDVGAGAGRFARHLAPLVQQITALDHSPHMLAAARAHMSGHTNARFVLGEWTRTAVERHDVVLSAWSLYRELDLELALTRLVAAARRLLIVIASDSMEDTPHYVYVLGALRQLGHRAELRMIEEDDGRVPVITLGTR
jgi:SAM-dependent methyltransferase